MVEPCCPVCDIVEQSSDVFRRTNVLEGHTQKCSPGVAIVVYSGVIDGEKRESIKIVDPHGLGVVVEQQAVAGFRGRWRLWRHALAGSHSLALLLCDGLLGRLACVQEAHQEDETEREHAERAYTAPRPVLPSCGQEYDECQTQSAHHRKAAQAAQGVGRRQTCTYIFSFS